MPVEFVVHEIADEYLRRWYRRIGRDRRGSRELARTYFEFLEAKLIRTAERPRGVRVADWIHPELNVWEFLGREAWAAFAVETAGGWLARLLGRTKVRVWLLANFDHPPPRAELERLATAVSSWGRTGSA
jgi:hypothetical protein